MIEQFGPSLGMPYTKAFGKGLFEIREKEQKVLDGLSFEQLREMRW
jgi:hypothetical protein